jgi:hypothetical protein
VRQLLHQPADHRASDDGSFVAARARSGALVNEAVRHGAHAFVLNRDDGLLVGAQPHGSVLRVDHRRDAGAVDVAVEDADFKALLAQRVCEVDGHGRLADPALAAVNRDDVLHAGQVLMLRGLHRCFLNRKPPHAQGYSL